MRRIAAIVLPDLACEMAARQRRDGEAGPFAVIVDHDDACLGQAIDKTAELDAVDRQAWQYGARPGQRASQAAAYVGRLSVIRIARARLIEALGSVAEIALGFGIQAALELRRGEGELLPSQAGSQASKGAARLRYPLGAGAGPLDTVWLDVSGCARLAGGEDRICAEISGRVRELGHRTRIAVADGPRLAQALARWTLEQTEIVVPPNESAARIQRLPVAALPLDPDMICWLGKLGILRIEDLARLDRARLSHRLGPAARDLLELVVGRDDMPLSAYQPPRRIVETAAFDVGDSSEGMHEITSTEPLSFVLRGLVARAVARLAARGEATSRVDIGLGYDRAVIALANRSRQPGASRLEYSCSFTLELPVPLSREAEILRALQAKLETIQLDAPVTSLTLTMDELSEQRHHQLALTGKTGVDPNALPILLAELTAHLGPGRVGVLRIVDSHRPEARSRLSAVDTAPTPPVLILRPALHGSLADPTRLLAEPLPLASLERGHLVLIDQQPFSLERLRPTARLDGIDWWSAAPLSRDYLHAWLRSATEPRADCEAWLYVDRHSGQPYLHGWFE